MTRPPGAPIALAASALVATILLAACGSSDGAGGVTASEASALNDAAAMLDARSSAAMTGDAGINPAATAAARAKRERTAPAVNATDNATPE